MVGVVVNHDLIATPVPTLHDRVIVRRDVPIKIAKPEPLPVSSRHHEYMLRPKAAREASVRPWLIHAVVRIVTAATVSDPFIVAGMNVRITGMTLLVHHNVVPLRRIIDRKSTRLNSSHLGISYAV